MREKEIVAVTRERLCEAWVTLKQDQNRLEKLHTNIDNN